MPAGGKRTRPVMPISGASSVGLSGDKSGYHVGIIYRGSLSGDVRVIHLAFHHDLRDHPPSEKWSVVATDIHRSKLVQLAALCRLIKSNPERDTIPYGFEFGDSGIDERGAVFVGGSSCGLTCATFVLAAFRRANIELLDVNSWRKRPEDKEAWERLLRLLEDKEGVATEHLEALRTQTECMRYRPEEVAGASVSEPRPLQFDAAEKRGAEIEMHLARANSYLS